jgi:hypothetical protein
MADNHISSEFSLVNTRKRVISVVLSITDKAVKKLENEIWFPGAITEIPKNIMSEIPISFNSDPTNPPPHPPYSNSPIYYPGAFLAVNQINRSREILPYHLIDLYNYTVGGNVYQHDWAYEKMTIHKEKLGYATMSPGWSSMTKGLM